MMFKNDPLSDLIKYLSALERRNSLVVGYDTVEYRKQFSINFGERLSCKGEHAKRLNMEPIWKRLRNDNSRMPL